MTHAIVTCSEHFVELALNELRRYHANLTCSKRISPQHLYIKNPGTFGHLTRPWKNKLPIYQHHLFPVHQTITLKGKASDFSALRQTAQTLDNNGEFTVQTRILGEYAYSAETVTQSLRPGQNMQTAATGRVLSILIDDRTVYLGVSWASQNISAFAGGEQPFDEPIPNHAGRKLLEALAAFKIHVYPGSHALDLGAAPGAWTEILRRRGVYVTAVAPKAMYDWLKTDPNVRTFCLTAEEFLQQCDARYDLVLNDMIMDVQDSARLMVDYAPYVKGIALMTLKLTLRKPQRLMDHAFRILRKAYKIIAVRQLVNNRKEVMLYLRPHH